MKLLRSVSLSLTILLIAGTVGAMAQEQTGNIDGRVLDSTGAGIPGAIVTARDDSRGIKQSAKTDKKGEYVIPLMPPDDNYTVTAVRDGFEETAQHHVVLQIAETTSINLTLKTGNVSETINVDASAVSLDTQTSSLGTVVTGETVEDLPLNGRATFRLIELTPGVTFSDSANGQFGDVSVNTTFDSNFSINGGRAQSNEILVDGIPTAAGFFNQITTTPIVDELQQFKVESSNLSAAYGRYTGGVVNVSTKSGTDSLHGDVFEFLRNDIFDARDWFTAHKGANIAEFRLNQYGGTLGGPVIIPKLYNGKDKTFFFISYQGTRRIQGQPYTASVPSVAERTGDFSELLTYATPATIYNPFSYNAATDTRATFTTPNVIPAAMINPVSAAILQFYPLPNQPGTNGTTTSNYFNQARTQVYQDVSSLRIDQNVNPRWHFFNRYEYSTTALAQPNQFGNIADNAGAVGTTRFNNQSYAFNNTVVISPSFLLDISYGFARWFQYRTTLSFGFDATTLGLPASFVAPAQIPAFPNIQVTGFAALSGQSYLHNGNDSHSILATLTKVQGPHTLIFGTDMRLHRIDFFNVSNPGGSFTFTQQFTRSNDTVTTNGSALASFLLGTGSTGTFPTALGTAIQDKYGALFVQDNWRALSKLTLNAGVRYDVESPYVDRHNELNYFEPNILSAVANPTFPSLQGGLVFANTNGIGRNVYSVSHLNFAPRVGLAWAPNTSMVIRSAFGIAYGPAQLTDNAVGTVPNQGFSSATKQNVGVIPLGGKSQIPKDLLSNPFPNGLTPVTGAAGGTATQVGLGVTVWNHNLPNPYTEQWSLDLQVKMPFDSLFDAAYVGSSGVHLPSDFDRNTTPFSTKEVLGANLATGVPNPFQPYVKTGTLSNATTTVSQLILPYPQFTSVLQVNTPWGHSIYNAAQVKFVKRSSKGITILTAFTWAKALSNVNGQLAPIGTTNDAATQDYFNLAAEKSDSELTQKYVFITHFVYNLPFGRGQAFLNRGDFTNKIVGGWKLNGIWSEQSGVPLSIGVTGVAGGATRPNEVLGVDPVIRVARSNQDIVAQAFNKSAFIAPAPYFPGTMRRTFPLLLAPGVQNLDISLLKNTTFSERYRLEFRVEAFNVTNNPHFAAPNTTLAGGSLGVISSTKGTPPPRQLQFAVKLFF